MEIAALKTLKERIEEILGYTMIKPDATRIPDLDFSVVLKQLLALVLKDREETVAAMLDAVTEHPQELRYGDPEWKAGWNAAREAFIRAAEERKRV